MYVCMHIPIENTNDHNVDNKTVSLCVTMYVCAHVWPVPKDPSIYSFCMYVHNVVYECNLKIIWILIGKYVCMLTVQYIAIGNMMIFWLLITFTDTSPIIGSYFLATFIAELFYTENGTNDSGESICLVKCIRIHTIHILRTYIHKYSTYLRNT